MKIGLPFISLSCAMLCLPLARAGAQEPATADAQPATTPAAAIPAPPDSGELLKAIQPALDDWDKGHYATGVYAIDGGRLLPLSSFRNSDVPNPENLKRSYALSDRPLFIVSAIWLDKHKADATSIYGFDWRFLDDKTHPKIPFSIVAIPNHPDVVLVTPQDALKPGLYSLQAGADSYPGQGEFKFGVEMHDEEAYWREVEKERPQNWQAYSHLGAFLWSRRDIDGALEQWKQSVELRPKLYETHNNYALALNAKGRVDEALEQYKLAVENGGEHVPPVRINYAQALTTAKHYDDAIAQYNEILKQGPNNPLMLTNLGTCYFKAGKYEQAVDSFQKALDIKPDYTEAKHGLELAKKQLDESSPAENPAP